MLGGVKREGATAKANQAARFASTFAKQTKQQTVQDADADITLFDEEDGDLAAFEDKIKDLAAIERARAVASPEVARRGVVALGALEQFVQTLHGVAVEGV